MEGWYYTASLHDTWQGQCSNSTQTMYRYKLKLIGMWRNIFKNKTRVSVVVGGVTAAVLLVMFASDAAPIVANLFAVNGTVAGCAGKTDDASSANGTVIKFGACAAEAPSSLDKTGQTIPDTNYTIPGGAIFMATTGSDSNSGTQAAPVKTLNKAISLTAAGGTIVVRGGTYRDWYTNGGSSYAGISKTLTIQAYPHEKPWFDGTDVINSGSWTSDGSGHWYMAWNTPTFCNGGYYTYNYNAQSTSPNNGPCTHYDMYGNTDANYPAAGDPQMVFVDGTQMREVASLAAATGGKFYYDWANKRIYISTNPSGHTVELAARPIALVMTGSGTKLLGLGFKRYATNEYDNTTSGAVYLVASNALVENSVFAQMAGRGLYIGSVGSTVNATVVANNGFNGLGSNGHQHSTGAPDGLVLQNSVFYRNNQEHYGINCTVSCAAAGVKYGHMDGFTVKNNIFDGNGVGNDGVSTDTMGFWCDLACSQGVIVNNVSRNNTEDGIIYEVSDTAIIASNLVVDSGKNGIRVASANTKVYNNTILNSGHLQLWIYDDSRTYGVDGWTDVGPDTTNVSVVNNIIGMTVKNIPYWLKRGSPNAQNGPAQLLATSDYNSFWRSGDAKSGVLVKWDDRPVTTPETYYSTIAAFTAARGYDAHSNDISSDTDPFFVDAASGNYTVRSNSVAYHSGTAIPSDVMSALGLSSGTGYSRGAINWPGK